MTEIALMAIDAAGIAQYVTAVLAAVGLKLLGAIALWIVGRWLVKLACKLVTRALIRQHLDATIISYIGSGLSVLLNIVLVVALLGFFGVQTATFAALLAGIGIAIGAAWSGLLSNLAAGGFLVLLPAFNVRATNSSARTAAFVAANCLLASPTNTPQHVC